MKHRYIYDIDQIYGENGEVSIISNDVTITFNARNLLASLDPMLYFAIKEVNKENEGIKNSLKETIKSIRY
tara:strand:- start:1102 stop:1314 length:213 start_codon:yes stop_codon:yes gene_type:complete